MTQTGSRLSVRLPQVRLCWKYLDLTTHATGSPSPLHSHSHTAHTYISTVCCLVRFMSYADNFLLQRWGSKEMGYKNAVIHPLLCTSVRIGCLLSSPNQEHLVVKTMLIAYFVTSGTVVWIQIS